MSKISRNIKIHSETIDVYSRRVGSKVREIKFEDGQKFFCLLTRHSTVVYAQLSRKVIFVYPEELQQTGLLQSGDGSVALYGIQSGCKVVTFDVTHKIKDVSRGTKDKKQSEDDEEINNSPKRFKMEEEKKKTSSNETIFHSLLTSDPGGMNYECGSSDNSDLKDFGNQIQEDIVYIEGGTVILEDAQLTDCLLLDNILVTLTTCVEGNILSFYTAPSFNNVSNGQPHSALVFASVNMFASIFIKELKLDKPLVSLSKTPNSSKCFKKTENSQTRPSVCGLKLSSSHVQKISFNLCTDDINSEVFAQIFGRDCTSLGSKVVLTGTPDGKILSVPLKGGEDQRASISVLFDLQEAVVLVSAMNLTNHNSLTDTVSILDCLLFVGKRGKLVIMYCEQTTGNKNSKMHTITDEKLVTGDVYTPIKVNSDCFVYSTKNELFSIRMTLADSPNNKSKRKLLKLITRRYHMKNVVSITKLPALSASEESAQRFAAYMENGKLVHLSIEDDHQSEEMVSMTTRQAGQRMKELILNLQEVAKRSEDVKHTSNIQNKVLSEMAKASHLAGIFLGEQTMVKLKPFLIEARTFLQHNGSEKQWMIECKITNKTEWTFTEHWTMCAYVFSSCKRMESLHASSVSNPVASIIYPLNNWRPSTFTVFVFPLDDGRAFLTPPINIKLHLHLRSCALNFPQNLRKMNVGEQFSPENDTPGIVLSIGSMRVDVTGFLEPTSPTKHDGASHNYGNAQNLSTFVAMETKHLTTGDWLSYSLKEIVSERMPKVHKDGGTKVIPKLALKCPGLSLMKDTLTVLLPQGGSILHWLFQSNSPVMSLLLENPSQNSLDLQSLSGIRVQIMQSEEGCDGTEVKVQIHTSSHHLLTVIMEAIHFQLSQSFRGCDQSDNTIGTEDKTSLDNVIQNIEAKLTQLKEKDVGSISNLDLEDIYNDMRNLNIRF